MLTEFQGHRYSTIRVSDLKRDGMGLELQRDGRAVAEVFFADPSGVFTISLFEEGLPLLIIEQLISEARATLVPVPKG
jgi:hypothetical protein